MKEYNFDDFLTDYKQEALQIDLSTENPLVFEILEKQKIKLSSADFDEVIEEVIEFCKKAIKSTKESLIVSFSKNHYRGQYKNGNPPFLSQMKTYIEYGNLYKEAISKKESNQQFESDRVLKNKKVKNHNQQMDYIDIMLRGYSNENDRKFLSMYLMREFKKAEKEHYNFEEFFNGLINGINKLKNEYKTRLYERKNELYFMLDGAKNDTLKYGDLKDESIEERHKKTIEYCESELSELSFENFPINLFHFTNNRYTGFLNYSEVEFIGNQIAQAFEELNKPQQAKTKKKKVLTNDTYYAILESCTIEAFECLKLKDHYPLDGSKAIWDISNLTISKGDGFPTDKDNELFRKVYIKENMRVTFLLALDRYWKDFEVKHLISREFFYKKCYQSLLFKISESPLWQKPNFGFDIDAEPCVLSFIRSMSSDIEARSIEKNESNTDTQNFSETSADEKITFINNFDGVTESKVIEYFTKNLVEKRYITKETLNKYLKQAFELKTVPVQKFSFENLPTQGKIRKVFYDYFSITAGKPNGRKLEYVKLLGEYFNGFNTNKINTNFSK